jgi:hypothetical protein
MSFTRWDLDLVVFVETKHFRIYHEHDYRTTSFSFLTYDARTDVDRFLERKAFPLHSRNFTCIRSGWHTFSRKMSRVSFNSIPAVKNRDSNISVGFFAHPGPLLPPIGDISSLDSTIYFLSEEHDRFHHLPSGLGGVWVNVHWFEVSSVV